MASYDISILVISQQFQIWLLLRKKQSWLVQFKQSKKLPWLAIAIFFPQYVNWYNLTSYWKHINETKYIKPNLPGQIFAVGTKPNELNQIKQTKSTFNLLSKM